MTPAHFTVAKNIILAEIPFFLAVYLFVFARHRSLLWWCLAAVFVAFLPNSAYTVTDIIHFIAAAQDPKFESWYVYSVLLPLYLLYMVINFEFYVISIMLAQQYIGRHWTEGLAKLWVPVIHLLCAVGVYLGRVQRLNSTDIIERPLVVFHDLIVDLTSWHAILLTLGFFILFYGLYLPFCKLNRYLWQHKLRQFFNVDALT
ncbi:MAG: DUF1361 domain-containing protein [Aestuariibacter sp.]